MVLDLRNNLGGLLSSVVRIAWELLPKGEIVYTIDKFGNRESHTSDGKHEIQIPLAVLINGSSASATEILSGAIKHYEKGTLIGTTTFGKGIVQRTFPIDDGSAVKLTISDYYTPAGDNIHGVGIDPDIVVEFDAEAYEKDETDNQLDKAVEILKEQMQ
ncbi:MAG: S41 family peptidase, partial [Butyrivibrio sp.]|nr:S41 family peptidase [Butyrivibrio sp.]